MFKFCAKFKYHCICYCNRKSISCSSQHFRSADLTRADMIGVTIIDCKWEACIMEDAILADVDISPFNLEDEAIVKMLAQADLSDAIWDNVTEGQERRLFEEKKQYDSKILELDRNQ